MAAFWSTTEVSFCPFVTFTCRIACFGDSIFVHFRSWFVRRKRNFRQRNGRCVDQDGE